MEPEQIADRCARLGLPRNRLAELADLNEDTVERTLNGKTRPYYETVKKLSAAVTAYELDQLAYLAGLHPQHAIERATLALCPSKQGAAQ